MIKIYPTPCGENYLYNQYKRSKFFGIGVKELTESFYCNEELLNRLKRVKNNQSKRKYSFVDGIINNPFLNPSK